MANFSTFMLYFNKESLTVNLLFCFNLLRYQSISFPLTVQHFHLTHLDVFGEWRKDPSLPPGWPIVLAPFKNSPLILHWFAKQVYGTCDSHINVGQFLDILFLVQWSIFLFVFHSSWVTRFCGWFVLMQEWGRNTEGSWRTKKHFHQVFREEQLLKGKSSR